MEKVCKYVREKHVNAPVKQNEADFPPAWNDLRQRRELFDGLLMVTEKKSYEVHRTILSASSSYFKSNFTYNSKYTHTCDKNDPLSEKLTSKTMIRMDLCDSVVESILDYSYTGNCNINWTNIGNLLAAADRYEVSGLINLCCKFLSKELKPKNCIEIYIYAKYYSCIELQQKTRTFILNSFLQVFKENQEVLKINVNDFCDILKDDQLNVPSEVTVFEVIRKWVDYNFCERSRYLIKLLTCVRFGLIRDKSFIANFIEWAPVKNNLEFLKKNISPLSSRRRIPYELIMVVGGWNKGSPTNLIEIYDNRADVWLNMRFTDSKRAYHGTCIVDGKVYVLGGFDGKTHFNSMRCYDPVNYKWEEKACMHERRCYVSVVVLDRKIYAIGGYNGHARLDSVEKYDPDKNQWQIIASMTHVRSDAGAAAFGDHIFVVGGFNGVVVLNSCEMYNPIRDSWTVISLMLSPRSGLSLVAYNNFLYAIGGYSGSQRLQSVERCNPKTSTWNFISEMACPRSNFATAIFDGKIYVIGGFDGMNTVSLLEYYDSNLNYWQVGTKMNINRSGHCSCVLEALPNVKGYSSQFKELKDAPCSLDYSYTMNADETISETEVDNEERQHERIEPSFQ